MPKRRKHCASSHRSESATTGSLKNLVTPTMYRAGGAALAASMAVSGGAYAAVQLSGSNADLGLGSAALKNHGLEAANHSSATNQQLVTYTLVVDGKSSVVSTDAANWAGALQNRGVTVDTSAGDTVSVSLTDTPEDDATVTVAHAAVKYETEKKVTKYQTVKEETADLLQGETKVKTKGVNGVSKVTYAVTTLGGKETKRDVIATATESEKVDEVVLVGTGTTTTAAVSAATSSSAAAGTSAADAQAIAASMLSNYGWGDDQMSCLTSLWNKESGWNYQAQNTTSGAYGIPQALPGSKMASAGSDWATNPATQIAWGLSYIAGRYSSPCVAWSHSQSTGWY